MWYGTVENAIVGYNGISVGLSEYNVSCEPGRNVSVYVRATGSETGYYISTINYDLNVNCTVSTGGSNVAVTNPVGSATITPTADNFSVKLVGYVEVGNKFN